MGKSPKSQRKAPKQSRSKAVVEAIYEATIRILPRIGSQSITTKKIADLAGVSVGSLYQYFPNKESVLGSLMDLVLKSEMEKFNAKINEINGSSMQETTDAVIDFALDMFLSEKEKVREIFKKAPELGRVPSIFNMRRAVVARLAEEMKKHHPGEAAEEYTRVSFIAVNSVMGVILTMLYDGSQSHSKDELAKELKSLLNSYFQTRTKK